MSAADWSFTFANGQKVTTWDWAVIQSKSKAEKWACYESRWGVNAAPKNPLSNTEKVRKLAWALNKDGTPRKGAAAQCYTCRVSRKGVPETKPVGDDEDDLLPCGCIWPICGPELVFGMHFKTMGGGANGPDKSDYPSAAKTFGQNVNICLYTSLSRLFGPEFEVGDLLETFDAHNDSE